MLYAIVIDNIVGSDNPIAEIEQIERVLADHARHIEHPLRSTWLIESNESLEIWSTRINTLVRLGDARYLIIPIRGYVNGILPASMWDWVNATSRTDVR